MLTYFRDDSIGLPWSEDEHRRFLTGLERLGKGDWRGISRNYVNTRTPTQVASHAQKYFLRQASLVKKKRRSSLFDLVGISACSSIARLYFVHKELYRPRSLLMFHYNALWSYFNQTHTMHWKRFETLE